MSEAHDINELVEHYDAVTLARHHPSGIVMVIATKDEIATESEGRDMAAALVSAVRSMHEGGRDAEEPGEPETETQPDPEPPVEPPVETETEPAA